MYCSGCGIAVAPGQAVCPQCGRPLGVPVPAVPGMPILLASYESKLRSLSVLWFIYAGLSLLAGIAGLTFARAFFAGGFGPWAHGPWAHGPMPPEWFGPAMLRFAWVTLLIRSGLALAAGFGLAERAQWGRLIAIAAAVLSLLKFPFGTALGIYTLVTLLGYRNTTLYDQL